MTATSSSTTQPPFHQRMVDIEHDVRLLVAAGGLDDDLATIAFRAGMSTLYASVVLTHEQLAEYRDAINAVLVATDAA